MIKSILVENMHDILKNINNNKLSNTNNKFHKK